MSYFTQPPKPKEYVHGDVPRFIAKHYKPATPKFDLEYILSLISWAEQEYMDVKAYLIVNRDKRRIKLFRKATSLNLLAYTKEFAMLVKTMDTETWDTIPFVVQETLIKTKEIYDRMSM